MNLRRKLGSAFEGNANGCSSSTCDRFAQLPEQVTQISLYKCRWSPFEGHEFSSSIDTTIVNGQVVYRDGELTGAIAGQRLEFTRAR